MKLAIYLPCYNVAKSIKKVLESFSNDILDSVSAVVVVDNCSTDNTMDILKEIQSSQTLLGQKLIILKNLKNFGLGGSQKTAYQYFIKNNYTHFMIVHGDGQGNGQEIAQGFLREYKNNPDIDVIIASRFMKSSDTSRYNRMRYIGNLFFNFLTFVLTGQKMTDSGAAIIFYRTAILNDFPFMHLTNSFQFNPQLNILLFSSPSVRIKEISMDWADSEDESNISSIGYCLTLLSILLRYRFNKTIMRKKGWETFHAESQAFEPAYQEITPTQSKA